MIQCYSMKTIKQIYKINASVEKVWDALTNTKIIDKWGGGPSKMSENVGEKFEFWGGDIYGRNIKVIKNKELVQEWFEGDWKEPSTVTFKLEQKGNQTTLQLIHKDIPDKDSSDIDDGWKKYYLGPLKELLEK